MSKHILTLFIAFTIICALDAQKIVFTPQWLPQAQFAGYYMAKEKGYYKEEGLDVTIVHPTASNSAVDKLKNSETNIITTHLFDALINNDKGLHLVNLLQTSQNSSLVLVTHPGTTSLEQLKDKRVGYWKVEAFSLLGRCLFEDKKIPVEWVHFQTGINYFIKNAVDAIVAMYYNEYFLLQHSGQHLTEKNAFRLSEMGYNIPEDGIYCDADDYAKNKVYYDNFTAASKKGWEYARTHQEETLEVVLKIMKECGVPANIAHQKWMLENVLNDQLDKTTGKATYKLSQNTFDKANEILLKKNLVKKVSVYKDFIK